LINAEILITVNKTALNFFLNTDGYINYYLVKRFSIKSDVSRNVIASKNNYCTLINAETILRTSSATKLPLNKEKNRINFLQK